MCCRGKWLVLPALALLLAGGALLAENLSAATDDVPVASVAPPNATPPADPDSPKSVADWKETGNVRGPVKPGNPTVHTIRP